MLPPACTHPNASVLTKICSLLTVNNANNYSPFLPIHANVKIWMSSKIIILDNWLSEKYCSHHHTHVPMLPFAHSHLHAPINTLRSTCFHPHALICMIPFPYKYVLCKQTIKQIITPFLTLLVPPSPQNAPVGMLLSAFSNPHATVLRQIYYLLTDNKTNNYFPVHHSMQIEKNRMSYFFDSRLLQSACSHIHAPVCMLPYTCFHPYKNMQSINSPQCK